MESRAASAGGTGANVGAYLAEFVGTFLLVFMGTGTIVVGQEFLGWGKLGTLEIFAVAAAFGLTLMVLVYVLGPISGAHVNPAVSFGMWSVGKLSLIDLIGYLIAQFLGAVVASAVLMAAVGIGDETVPLGGTALGDGVAQASGMFIEFILTLILVFAVAAVLMNGTVDKFASGLTIGFTLLLTQLWGIPMTGASVNPARSFGPAILGGKLADFWLVYLIAPIVGGIVGAWVYKIVYEQGKK